ELVVSHNSQEPPMPFMPTPVVFLAQPVRIDIREHNEAWQVEGFATRPPKAQEKLMILGCGFSLHGLHLRREYADAIQYGPPVCRVPAAEADTSACADDEGCIAVIKQRQRCPMLAR